jgi:octopine/nopaline transport system substrate-binding protein
MRALSIAASVLWLGVFASPGLAADWSSIRIGTDGTYPPWNATSGDGDVIGFEIDLANDLCARMGARCEIVTQTWNGMIPALTTGRYDAIMAGMAITDERERTIRFSSCYASEPAMFAVSSDHPLVAMAGDLARINLAAFGPDDQEAIQALRRALAGSLIGTRIATAQADFLRQFFADIASVQPFDTVDNMMLDLDAGRIDAVFLKKSAWKKLIEREVSTDLIPIGPDITGGILGKGVGAGFRVEDRDLRAMFDEALAAAADDGTITRLSERWFGYDLSC